MAGVGGPLPLLTMLDAVLREYRRVVAIHIAADRARREGR